MTKIKDMVEIDPKEVEQICESAGISRWKMGTLLNPHLTKIDAYRTLKRWMDLGRMPRKKRDELWNFMRNSTN